MQVVAVQYDILWENRQGNYAKIRDLLRNSEIEPGALIVLPEMFSSGFSMNVSAIAEADPSESEAFLAELAAEYQACVLGGLVFEQENGRGRNELAVFGPDSQLVGRYQKNRTFRYTGESDHYENGTELLVFEWGGFQICPLICYDLRFPELFRRGAKQGANLFPVMASWPNARVEHWITLLRARAIENLAMVVGVNRTGEDPGYQYDGRSMVIDHWGDVLADAGKEEACLVQEVSPAGLLQWREEFPALADLEA